MLAMPATVLHTSEFYRVEMLLGERVVRVVRNARPFSNARDVESACAPVQVVLDSIGRASHALLVDSRAVVGRNDPTSEDAFADHRGRMLRAFSAAAILVQTATGKLQSERLLRAQGAGHVRVFLREQDAVLFLEGGAADD